MKKHPHYLSGKPSPTVNIELYSLYRDFNERYQLLCDSFPFKPIPPKVLEAFYFLDGLVGFEYKDYSLLPKTQFITSGNKHYKKCLVIKLCVQPKTYIIDTLNYVWENFEAELGKKSVAIKQLIDTSFIEDLNNLKSLWACQNLQKIVEKWVQDSIKVEFKETASIVRIIIPNKDKKQLLIDILLKHASTSSKKKIPALIDGIIESPIEFDITAAELGGILCRMNNKKYFGNIPNTVIAKWSSKCFKVLNRKKKSGSNSRYKHPSERTIADYLTENRRWFETKGTPPL